VAESFDDLCALYPWRPRPACGPGWHPVVEAFCERLAAAVPPPLLHAPLVLRIRESQGKLRIEVQEAGRYARRVDAFVREAVEASEGTCQQCGAPGLRARRSGWWATLCDAHEAQGMWL
jgi:hypothetical protein